MKFHTYLSDMYTNPTAQVYTPGYLSTPILLQKGTRQGCPLSPLLFDLALETLARYLEDSDLYKGNFVGQKEDKMASFADDVILFFSDPAKHLKGIIQTLTAFRKFSGYAANVSKSEILELGPKNTVNLWHELGTTIKVASKNITYLGIKIGKSSDTIYSLNYPLIDKIVTDIYRWMHLPLFLMGRCHLARMMGFSSLLYPMPTLPLLLKHVDVNRLNSAFVRFIWAGKCPRIALHKLMSSTVEGGINFPNLRGYNLSCLMRHVLDWFHETSGSSNWEQESELATTWSLISLAHTVFSQVPIHIKHSVTLRNTITAWKETRKAFGLPLLLSKYMPLWG